jgi:carbon-monoxide dehydrogenase large subunit/6-hydroxypseudooxynicotine dehydrogenase subunit gamma
MIEAPPEALEIVDGRIMRKGQGEGASVTLAQIAKALEPAAALKQRREPGLSAEGWFHSDGMNYPYGVHVAVVNVDRDIGAVRIERYLAAYDVGRAVNPMLMEGQIVGSLAQGLGGALLEEFVYDDNGSPVSVTLADYLLPTLHDVPDVEVLLTEDAPSPLNMLGLKGGGESGITAVAPALAAAIDDALGMPGAITELPVTPWRLKRLVNAGGGR